MSANVEAMVREGINAYKAGNKEEAKALLLKATEIDQMNEQAWLWLSGLMDSAADQRTCLENVLAINPNSDRAKQGLSFLTGQTSSGNPSPFPAPSSGAPPAAPSPTSVEWGVPDSSPPPSVSPAAIDTSAMIPDDWVSGLNLPTNDAKTDDAPASPASPFGDFSFDNIDDDTFGGPFTSSPLDMDNVGSPAPSAPTPAQPTRRAKLPREPERAYEPEPEPVRELFGDIPAEIKVTRLPGTRERTPLLLTLGLIVLILLNLGAASLLMINLLT